MCWRIHFYIPFPPQIRSCVSYWPYLGVLHQCLQAEGLHLLRGNRGETLSVGQPITTKTPQAPLQHERVSVKVGGFKHLNLKLLGHTWDCCCPAVCVPGSQLPKDLSLLPSVLPETECSLWGLVRWSTEHICPPQSEAETPAAPSIHPLLTNPVKLITYLSYLYLPASPKARVGLVGSQWDQ